jgi:hypothetical protein
MRHQRVCARDRLGAEPPPAREENAADDRVAWRHDLFRLQQPLFAVALGETRRTSRRDNWRGARRPELDFMNHSPPEGSLSALVGRQGSIGPVGRVR